MTIDEYAQKYSVKKKETVIKWILDGLVPGADLATNYIPDSARQPYTNARAKSADSIYYSIVKATKNLYHVTAKIYNLYDDEFNGYINRLVEAGLIIIRVTDGVTYYDSPIPSKNCNKKFIIDAIEASARGIAQGVTTVLANANA